MNSRRTFLKQALTSSLALQVGCSVKSSLEGGPTPPVVQMTPTPTPTPTPNGQPGKNNNVLFIAIDDLNDWLGCYTSKIATGLRPFTPNIDYFSSQAMLFENAYTPVALCNPARHAIFYGAEPYLSGVMNNTGDYSGEFSHAGNCFFDGRTSLNAFFKAKNYETIGVGKLYHGVGEAATDGTFERYFDVKANDPKRCKVLHIGEAAGMGMYGKLDTGTPKDGCPNGIVHIDAATVNWAVSQLDRLKKRGNAGRPFFLGVGFARPHAPYYAPNWCWNKYSEDAIKAYVDDLFPKEANLIHPGILQFYQERVDGQQTLFTRGELCKYLHGYLAAITFMDHMFKTLLDELRSSALWNNTTVVVVSDNGYHFGEKQLQAKNTIWERATKVPLIVRVPGLNEGTRTSSLVSTMGIYKTLTELTFGEKPAGIGGESFFPVLENPSVSIADAAVSAVSLDGDTDKIDSIHSVGYSVREIDYRYTLFRLKQADGSFQMVEELYHVSPTADPGERVNLVLNGRGAYAAICDRMQAKIPVSAGLIAPLPTLNCE